MKKNSELLTQLILIATSILVTLLMLEITVRIIGNVNEDGQFYFLERRIPPYQLPIHAMERSLQRYLENTESATLLYDEQTGWILNPDNDDVNMFGMHSLNNPCIVNSEGITRIALFGDSFVAGDEVSADETWAVALEHCLNENNSVVEVLNFGVSAYGMDQAYLRYLEIGQAFEPDIVIFGFQPGDMHRNMTAFRPLVGGSLPFSKPRYIIEDEQLRLLNQPAIAPDALIDVYQNFDSHSLVQYEILYDDQYQDRWWSNSRLLSLVSYLLRDERYISIYDEYTEQSQFASLAMSIIDNFVQDVENDSSQFIIVHLPPRPIIETIVADETSLSYAFMLNEFEERFPVIDISHIFINNLDQHWMPGGHYSAEANLLVGQEICNQLLSLQID